MFSDSFPRGVIGSKPPKNPAIQLFGQRLFGDQAPTELLVEFLLVVNSSKKIGKVCGDFATPLPKLESLTAWPPGENLHYSPKARLNLKLFAFMGASRLDSRHAAHREHYKELLRLLQANIRVTESGSEHDVLRTLENLLVGFQGAGGGRTWCAQSFLPVCPGFLAGESIWNEKAARDGDPKTWEDVVDGLKLYFSLDKHLFLARGGEVLYLQICNALRQMPDTVQEWAKESGVCLEPDELEPLRLHAALQEELCRFMAHCPQTVTDIANFIDTAVEPHTAEATDRPVGSQRFVEAGWCPADSWQEGYLFAVDVLRLCRANLDVLERLRLFETACAMQVLRSLASKSAQACPPERTTSWPGYRLAVSAPDEKRIAVKRISQHTVRIMEKLVYRAVRCDDVSLPSNDTDKKSILKEADTRYGSKLLISTAKRIGLLVPRRGAGARFTLNEQLLRFLVVTTVPVGGRMTFDSFKKLVTARHGMVFDSDGLAEASAWADGVSSVHLGGHCDAWLQDMLEAAGMLIHLSDSCALVENPAGENDSDVVGG